MDMQDLKEYLGMVVDMEANCHLLEALRKTLREQLAFIKDPQPQVIVLPSNPEQPTTLEKPVFPENELKQNGVADIFVPILCGLLCAIGLAMFVPIMYAIVFIPFGWVADFLTVAARRNGESFTSDSITYFLELAEYWFQFALKYTVLPGVLIGGCVSLGTFEENKKTNNEIRRKYNEKLNEYNRKSNEELSKYNQGMQKFQHEMQAYHLAVAQEKNRVQAGKERNEQKRSFLQTWTVKSSCE